MDKPKNLPNSILKDTLKLFERLKKVEKRKKGIKNKFLDFSYNLEDPNVLYKDVSGQVLDIIESKDKPTK